MEQKNENEFLMLKNYCFFLTDLGLNISFSQDISGLLKNVNINKAEVSKMINFLESNFAFKVGYSS